MKGRSLQVAFLAFLLIGACNKEEFVGTSIQTEGADAACSAGTDIPSCEAIPGCQVALEDVESVTPVFAACIADPDPVVVVTPPEPEPEQQPNPNPNPNPNPPSNPEGEEPEEEEKEPTIDEAYQAKCENLDDKYLLIRKVSGKSGSYRSKKVKICHQTSNGEHAIIVACPALKAHRKHDDYLGACK